MRNLVLIAAAVAACAGTAAAQDHVLSILRPSSATVLVDSVTLKYQDSTIVVPTPGYGGPGGTTDSADLGLHDWPGSGIEVFWTRNGFAQSPLGIRTPVQDTWYDIPDSSFSSGRIKFYMGVGGVEEGSTIQQSRLSVSPNPFSTRGTINWTMAEAGSARLEVFDATGQLVRTLVEGRLAAGRQSATWNGLDNDGNHVGTGIYLARLTTDAGRTLAKLILTD